jgi:hypothetical protein
LATTPANASEKSERIVFENQADNPGEKVTLGPKAEKLFHETMKGEESDFDPKFLEKSESIGIFTMGKESYELHVDIIVHKAKAKPPRIWSSKLAKDLTHRLLEGDGSWKKLLSE